MSTPYRVTIGLEVHAELNTKSKMFCGCKNDPHHGTPNAYTCPICLAHPGTLPVPNEEAITKVLMFGRAVNATQADFTEFDRKNYFYPDIPKAYQISQYAFPFLTGGELAGVKLTRVHLEEDTARSQHDHAGVSLVDFNRAGVPLMELVTEPVIHDAKTAGDFARELQLILKTLKISGAQMEKGEMRVEANISVSQTDILGTKVEVKNLNSFKSVEGAIAYEIERQTKALEAGETLVQETRGWDEVKLRTFSQRSKETAKDYRYFPDPDLPKMVTSKFSKFDQSRLDELMPELPSKRRLKYSNLGIPSNQIEQLLATSELGDMFEEIVESGSTSDTDTYRLCANYLTSDVVALLALGKNISIQGKNFLALMVMLKEAKINSRTAKDLLTELIDADADPLALAQERGLLQSSDPAELNKLIEEVIADNPSVVVEYYAGKEASVQFLVGQGMKKSRGTANPGLLMELLKKQLSEKRP